MAERIAFTSSQTPEGKERIELRRQRDSGFLRKASSECIARREWVKCAPMAGLAAISRLHSLDERGEIEPAVEHLIVPPSFIAKLTDNEAHAIGLPPATDLILQLQSTGALHDGSIQVEKRWLRRGGVPTRARPNGARIRDLDGIARLPDPLYSTNALVDHLAASSDPDERRARFAELRDHLGDLDDSAVDPDGFISKTRIAYAASFSLDLRTHGGLFDFDPVLFARSARESQDGDLIDQKEASLLTESEQQRFRSRFRSQSGGKRSYLLSDGTILFLDPLLGRALDIVREQQSLPGDARKEFARSPQRFIRERLSLDETSDDDAADRLFIETQQYSERVAGIETWQKPVLPWLKPSPNNWLPERFGIKVGDDPDATFITVEPEQARPLADQIAKARETGAPTVLFEGQEVPASAAAQSAAEALATLVYEQEPLEPGRVNEPRPSIQTFFLKVGENFETLDYSRLAAQPIGSLPSEPPAFPTVVRSTPKPHQLEGYAWLTEAWRRGMPGVLLADDMGLGKTFQALAFLAWLRTVEAPERPILIVAPTGLLRNWQAEIGIHLEHGSLGRLVEAFGANLRHHRTEQGNDIRGGTSKLDISGWSNAGVVLTTFETMRDYHMSFARVPFSAIVYDEIQKLKNPASQMTRAAKTMNARMQIGMTGTPVENRLQDLWSITDVIYPGFLGSSRDFENTYPADDEGALRSLQDRLIEPAEGSPAYMLRRMKDSILTGLPTKTVETYKVTMPVAQARAYDQVLARARALRQSGDRGAMLKILHMLRGTSLHPDPPGQVADFDQYISASARLSKTFDLLSIIRDRGEKALIFCEDLEMQAFLAIAIQEKFGLGMPVPIINGTVAGTKRQTQVTEFQARPPGFDVMILSPKAGGVGLTITAANHVIHLSRWWNPAVEDQATDRVYRIGQEKPVTVHLPMAVHPDGAIGPSSFDVRLNDLMERKRSLSRGLLVPPESEADIDDMLSAVLDGEERQPSDPQVNEADERSLTSSEAVESVPTVSENARLERPTLVLRTRVSAESATPVDAAEARAEEIRRVVFEVGGLRDWTIFHQHLENEIIDELTIIDPYCCANERARRHLVDFVTRFDKAAAGLHAVRVVSFDAASLDTYEGDEIQRFVSKLPNTAFRHVQKSRRSSGDLHDRSVTARLRCGDTVVWDLGRGIEGVMTANHACTVNAFRMPSNHAA